MKEKSSSRIQFLRDLPLFSGVSNDQLEKIAINLVTQKFSAGEIVSWEGEPSNGIYIVKSGWLKVTKSSEKGRELTLNLLKKSDSFNLISVFSDDLNPANVEVLEDAELFYLDSASFYQIAFSSPEICMALVRQMAGRIKSLTELAGHLSLSNVESRIAHWLLEESTGDSIKREKWLTQNELASIVGTVPDVISRVLRDFVEEGLIRFNRREIKITDRQSLNGKIRNLS